MKTTDIKAQLLKDFSSGKYHCGDKIPTEKDLVAQFNVSRSTLREAIGALVEEGLLERRQGSGTYLVKPRRQTNMLIGIMVAHISQVDTIYARLVQELEHCFSEHGFSIILGSHGNNHQKALQQIDRFRQLKVAGVVLVPILMPGAEADNLELVRQLGAADIPFVLADSQISARSNSWFSCVSVNNFQGMRMLVKHLYALGHTRIAHLKGLAGVYSTEMRYDGYREALRECGLAIPDGYVKEIQVGPVSGQGRLELQAMMALAEPPTAITCAHDLIAGNVIEELRKAGHRVPEDVAVTGFDNILIPGLDGEFLTTVEQPVDEMAQAVVDLLCRKINGTLLGEVQQGIQCRLKVRHSCQAYNNSTVK